MCNSVKAVELKTTLNIIQYASETKYLENNQGYISKSIVDSNKDTGEVTIELKVANTKKGQENTEVYENTNGFGSILYTLDEEAVKEINMPSNINTFEMKADELASSRSLSIIQETDLQNPNLSN